MGKGQVSESIPVRGLGQNLAHRTCSISIHGLPSTHLWSGPKAWVSRVRKGRPGITVVDKTPALGEPQSMGDTVIGGPLHPHGGHSPVLEDAASPRGEVQPLPGVCPVSPLQARHLNPLLSTALPAGLGHSSSEV